MKKEKVEQNKLNKSKKVNFKSYIRDFLLFTDKYLIKTIGILIVVAILLIALTMNPIVNTTLSYECEGVCRDGVTLISEYWSRLQVLLVTAVAGIVPYIYAPTIGFIGYILSEVANIAYIIKGYGYLSGIGIGVVPLILNILTICLITALGIYICRTVTVGYKISNIKNMNFMNFRIKLYEVLQKEEKVQALTNERDEKIKKLEDKKEKINYLQVLNIAVITSVLQFISVLIQEILI